MLCLRCSVLPGMGHWLNLLKMPCETNSSSGLSNFKQGCGLLCEIITQLLAPGLGLDSGELVALFRQTTLLYLQCTIECDESFVRIGNSCFRHLVLNCGENFDSISPELWQVTASALCLMVKCNLSTVQRSIGTEPAADEPQYPHRPFRLQHLSQQVFNLSTNDPLPQASGSSAFLTALLSYQLAINTIANIICCNNTILIRDEKVLSHAVFAENMQNCASVEPGVLSTLCSVLKSCCEFGVDFETALVIRRKLQRLFGFAQLPDLNQVTELSNNLLIVGLANLPPPVKELERWLEFLVHLYLQQMDSGRENRRFNPFLSMASKSKFNYVSYDPADEETGEPAKIQPQDRETADPESVESNRLLENASPEVCPEIPTDCDNAEDQKLTGTDQDQGCRDPLFQERMAAALESYKKQKQLVTAEEDNRPKIVSNSPKTLQKVQESHLAKDLLLSALHLMSGIPHVDGQSHSSFQHVREIMAGIIQVQDVDPDISLAYEEFLKSFS